MATVAFDRAFGTRNSASGASSRREVSLAKILAAFRTAMDAAADYKRLDARSDASLASEGLTRADVARLVKERHFA